MTLHLGQIAELKGVIAKNQTIADNAVFNTNLFNKALERIEQATKEIFNLESQFGSSGGINIGGFTLPIILIGGVIVLFFLGDKK